MLRIVPRWRQFLKYPIKLLARAILFTWGFYWIKVTGTPAGVDKAPIIISNHVGFIEPLYLFGRTLPMGVSRIENASMAVLGNVFRALQMVFVDRRNPNSRQQTSAEIINRTRSNVPLGFELPADVPTFLSPLTSPRGGVTPRNPSSPISPAGKHIHSTNDEAESSTESEVRPHASANNQYSAGLQGWKEYLTEQRWPQVS